MLTPALFAGVVLGLVVLQCAERRLDDWLDRRQHRRQLERKEGFAFAVLLLQIWMDEGRKECQKDQK